MKQQVQINKTEWGEIELGEVLDYEQPTKYIVESTDYNDNYKIPVLTAGKSFILGYTNETNGIYDTLPVIIFDDFTTDKKFVDFKFKVKSSAMKILKPKNELINIKYVYLVMQRLKFDAKRHKRYYLSAYQKLKIPMPFLNGKPDIQVQKKIVLILEKAEELKQKREEADKLTKEYLQSVFYDMFGDKNKFEKVELKKIGEIVTGNTPKRIKAENYGGDIPWIKPSDLDKELYVDSSEEYISEIGKREVRMLKKGSVLVSCIGNIGKVAIAKIELCTNQQINSIIPDKNKITPEYIYFSILNLKKYFEDKANKAVVPIINKSDFSELQIPLPPLPLQQKFSSIVEQVEKLKEKQQKSKEEIDNLFNSLMQKAFNVELVR